MSPNHYLDHLLGPFPSRIYPHTPYTTRYSSSEIERGCFALIVHSYSEMHPRAFYVLALLFLALEESRCEDGVNWYSGLHNILATCPYESWNNTAQEEFFEKYRRCVQERALTVLDELLGDDVIPVFDGLELVRFREDGVNATENQYAGGSEESWTSLILKRLVRVLRSHVFKIDVDQLTSALSNNTQTDDTVFQGRRRRHRRRHNHMMPMMMMGLLLMGSILVPMGFQFLAVLGGKALLLAKMALILSSIQGLKKIATNGVNYGLYHAPVAEGWHERSQPEEDFNLHYKTYLDSRP